MYAVRLTTSGEKALKNAQPAVESTNDSILKALPNEERKEFLNALNRIIQLVGNSTNSRPSK